MKFTPVLIFIALVTGLSSCKKESNYPIVGKWQQVKLRIYNQDNTTGVISGDTSFQSATFGRLDYAQFNNNCTCVLSETGSSYNSLPPSTPVQHTQNYTYVKSGSGFALAEVPQGNLISDIITTYTVSGFSANTLTVHSVSSYLNPGVKYKTISDAYYTK